MRKIPEPIDQKPVSVNCIFWSDRYCTEALTIERYCSVYKNGSGNYYFGGAHSRRDGVDVYATDMRRKPIYRIVVRPKLGLGNGRNAHD